jgi:F-type H+-transporting ATPase subunit a
MAGAPHDPLDPEHLFHHVQDSTYFELPRLLGGKLEIPQPLQLADPIIAPNPAVHLEAFDLTLTKFMVLQLIAAIALILIFVPFAQRTARGGAPRGRLANLLEVFLLFIRDEVARPAIGKHDADRFLPYLWTLFFFVLGCNLLGLVPWAGSATGALACTGMLALCSFAMVVGSGMSKLGTVGFWKAQVPHMDLPFVLAIFLLPMIFLIEILGLLIKHIVLAVRLLANMMAGHLVLAVLLAFIAASAGSIAWYGVAPASVLGATALMLLELFVAFLQAYIFTFLTALFIGMAVHPH